MNWALFDSQAFAEQAHGGVSRYFAELMSALAARGSWRPAVHAGVHTAPVPWRAGVRRVGLATRVPKLPRTVRLIQATNRVLAPRRLPADLANAVYHPTWYDGRMLARFAGLAQVITVHDLIPESWPEVTTPRQLEDKRQALTTADAIICVSGATRDDLVDHYPETADRAVVVPLGLPSYLAEPSREARAETRDPYVVYVGKRGSYKDFSTLLRALKRCPSDVRLVAVGGGPLSDVSGQVMHYDRLSDAGLASVLAGARALVSTSLKEGFGLPPLEALAQRTPVILTDIPVYREVYGDYAAFFEPGNDDALADLLVRAVEGDLPAPPPRAELRQRFSWERVAEATESVYRSVAAS